MSIQCGKVIKLILLERFGPVVEKVGAYLFQYGTNPLLYIVKNTELPLSTVKDALCVLVKYNLVTFVPNRNINIANYTIHPDRILLMIRYPKYNNLIKKKFGDEAEMIVEEVLQRGYWSGSELILKVVERLKKTGSDKVALSQLKDKFVALVTAKYLVRQAFSKEDKPVPNLQMDENELHKLPDIDLKILAAVEAGKESANALPDKSVYWTINFDRFHQDMRDKLIVNAYTRKFDENVGEFVRLLLAQMYIRTQPWADTSNPVPILEIKDILRKQNTHPQLIAFFDQYVNVIEQDSSNLIRKAGEASGGSFQIFLKETFTQFAWETVEQVVLERFDSKAARIFRLVKTKNYIEPDNIQRLVMIPGKEVKRLSYELVKENFFKLQELRKTGNNNGPSKSFTLFHIDLLQIVRMLLEHSYKSLYNIMTRKNHEKDMHKRIIYKKIRVDAFAMGATDEEQLTDVEEMLTPPEREVLAKIDNMMKKLNTVELEIDETIFLLQTYLVYQ